MEIGVLFWVIYVIAVLAWGAYYWERVPWWGSAVVTMILFFLLGWKVFGFVVK